MQFEIKTLCRCLIWGYLSLLPFWLPAEGVRTFQYDKNNQLIKEQKANGHEISYEYDSCGRVTKQLASDETVVEYGYDKNGNCIRMADSHGSTVYTYDLFNQLTGVQFPNSNTISYKYDVRGRLIEMVYPNHSKVSYVYDSSSRLLLVADQTGVTKYEYDDITNTLTAVALSNGVLTEYLYDRVKRITDVTHKRSDGSIIASFHYCFDANGNRTEITESGCFGNRKAECIYDKLNRLISVEYPEGWEKYTYNGIGNRLSKETPDGVTHYDMIKVII